MHRKLALVGFTIAAAGCGGGGDDEPANRAPIITPSTLTVQEDALDAHYLLAIREPDGDTFTVTIVTPPSHGQLHGPDAQYRVTYLPAEDYSGSDSFVVRATDALGAQSADITIPINVTAVNDPPIAAADQYQFAGTPLDVTANDIDVDGDALTVSVLTQPTVGTVTVVDNRLVFAPATNFVGPVRFDYRVTDAAGVTSDAEVQLMIGSFPRVLMATADECRGLLVSSSPTSRSSGKSGAPDSLRRSRMLPLI